MVALDGFACRCYGNFQRPEFFRNNKGKRYLQKDGWFKAKWFVHNDDNYEKLLDGTFDFKEEQSKAPAKQPKFVDARPKEDK